MQTHRVSARPLLFSLAGIFGCSLVAAAAVAPEASGETLIGLLDVNLQTVDAKVEGFLKSKQKAVREHPKSATAVGELAISYEMNGFLESALLGYQLAAKLDPSDPIWPYYEGLVLASMGEYESAIRALNESIEMDAVDYRGSYYWLGVMHLELNELDQSQVNFRKAKKLGAERSAALGLAQIDLRRGNIQDANERLINLAKQGRHPKVELLLNRVSKQLGSTGVVHSSADGELTLDDWLGERAARKRQFEASISAALAHYRVLLSYEGTHLLAFKLIDDLHARNPNNERLVSARLHSLVLRGEIQEHRSLLESAYRRWPENIEYVSEMANLAIGEQRQTDAMNLFKEWISLDGETVEGHVGLALTYLDLQRFEDAQATLEEVLATDDEGYSHLSMGYVMSGSGQFKLATCYFQLAKTINHAHSTVADEMLAMYRGQEIQMLAPTLTDSGKLVCDD